MPARIVTRRSKIHGNGMFATRAIPKGEKLIQYKGRLRSHDAVDRAYGEEEDNGHTFLFTLNDDYVIDANLDANNARWINHSCNPNCEAVFYEDEGGNKRKDEVWIESRRAIKPGEELSYNYGITLAERHTPRLKKLWACRCGARNCTGTMLQKKK